MGYPLKGLCFGAVAAVWVLAAPAAQAFTFENREVDGAGAYAVPKFDIEEQARNFRSGGSGTTTPGKSSVDTPVGKMQFGVQQGPAFGSGMGFGPATGSRAGRADFERMVTPDSLR
jgi:hypothetical protein